MNRTREQSQRAARRKRTQVIALTCLLSILGVVVLRPLVQGGAASHAAAAVAPASNHYQPALSSPPQPLRVVQPSPQSRDLFDSTDLLAKLTPAEPHKPDEPKPTTDHEAAARELAQKQAHLRQQHKLQATILHGEPRAMINGSVWRVGEQLSGWTLTEIANRHVTLQQNGQTVTLVMTD